VSGLAAHYNFFYDQLQHVRILLDSKMQNPSFQNTLNSSKWRLSEIISIQRFLFILFIKLKKRRAIPQLFFFFFKNL